MAELKKPSWLKLSEPKLKELIAQLAEKHPPSVIGHILRDQYGVPTVRVYGKKLGDYLRELGIERNEDLENAQRKVERIKEHLKSNITDRKAKHKLQKAQSRLNVLRRYFSRREN
ncbi:30S ribosomal protein S15 [Candidatus Pacearchaeota archaeon]|nr:MAG: 30S ribosomal protein S15 [Candidatus Pacearchaeota archaeon]